MKIVVRFAVFSMNITVTLELPLTIGYTKYLETTQFTSQKNKKVYIANNNSNLRKTFPYVYN